MENEIPKGTTNQLLIQFIPDAAVFTNTSFISTTTINTYRARILSKPNFKTNADLIRYALEKKLV